MRALPLLALALALAACEPAEKRAEAHYQRALALLADGDSARAAVEFRNVFRLDGDHHAARLAYARLLAGNGDREGAMGQYLRLAEQDPRNLEGQRELAELALALGDGETAAFHAAQALTLAPGDPRMRALRATLDWRRGGRDRIRAVSEAEAVAAEHPEVVAVQLLLVTARLAAGDPAAALARADGALALQPGVAGLHLARLAALERLGDQDPVGAELRDMRIRFPRDAGVRDALLQWHLRQGDTAGAEALLREAAAADPGMDTSPNMGTNSAANPQPALALVAFLLQTQGPEAARAELAARVALAAQTGGDPAPFRRAEAGIDFAAGRQAEAIATLSDLLKAAAPSDATRDLQLALAEMLAATGETAASDALVAAILAGDPAHGGALKFRARAALAEDRPEASIRDLRAALAEAPRDAEAMTIMAFAHAREGSRELMGERLARAVEVSDRGSAESRRYAAFLLQDGRAGPAEGVVIDALRRAPGDRALLDLLGKIHLSRQDWLRAEAVASRLQALAGAGDPVAAPLAAALAARSLAGRGRPAEGLARLGPDADPMVVAELLARMVATGDGGGEAGRKAGGGGAAAAAAWLDARIAADPGAGTMPLRLFRAELLEDAGDAAGAGRMLDAAVAAAPDRPEPHAARFRFLAAAGRPQAAAEALAAGFAAVPPAAARPLLLLRAGLREAAGDRAGAIADYRAVRAVDLRSGEGVDDPLVANNLASLLGADAGTGVGAGGAPEDGPEARAADLEAAFRLARQLAGSPTPQFRDTLGWILVRRGDPGRGLAELDPAATALPGNGSVQFHRAEALRALGRDAEARAAYAQALAADAPPLSSALATAARTAAAALEAPPSGG